MVVLATSIMIFNYWLKNIYSLFKFAAVKGVHILNSCQSINNTIFLKVSYPSMIRLESYCNFNIENFDL